MGDSVAMLTGVDDLQRVRVAGSVWNREYNDLGKQGWECSLRIVKKHFKVVRVVD